MQGNENILNAIRSYLMANEDEKKVILKIIKALDKTKIPLNDVKCLSVSDNTMNGDDTIKTSWRVSLLNPKTEKAFYIEVIKNKNNRFISECYTFEGEKTKWLNTNSKVDAFLNE